MKEPDKIRQMFANLAPNYDLVNSILSCGVHKVWKKEFVNWCNPQPNQLILDCATGTGDIALGLYNKTAGHCKIWATDFCEPMLEIARHKLPPNIKLQKCDILDLPFDNNFFDLTTISFGIRNVQDPKRGLNELARVTKPHGKVMIMEFGHPNNQVFKKVYNIYTKLFPFIGRVFANDPQAYAYLQKSSLTFPCGADFLAMLNATQAFTTTTCRSLWGGVVYMYQGERSIR